MTPEPAPPPAQPQRLAFLGTPADAVPSLRALVAAGFGVAPVVTAPPARRGRRAPPTPSPVASAAEALGLPVSFDLHDVVHAEVDLGVVVAYGRIIPVSVLAEVPMVNVHFSLLPRWRGAAPVERALLAGDERTGVCVMAVEAGLDTGGVYASAEVAVGERESAPELRARRAQRGARRRVDTHPRGLGAPRPQHGEATYAAKIEPDELRLDWGRPAAELDRVVRVGGAWTTFRGARLKVWRARPAVPPSGAKPTGAPPDGADPPPGVLDGDVVGTGEGALQLLEVQPEGRRRLSATEWSRGVRPDPGERLGT